MSLHFTKMHGLGNDFLVIDAVRQKVDLRPADLSALAKRDTGIGFDQCLLIEPSKSAGIDFYYRIFNADGQEVGQCGNGARCLARFAKHYGLTTKDTLIVATKTTTMRLKINLDHSVTVEMEPPKLSPQAIPMRVHDQAVVYSIPQTTYCVHAINVGNPHAVLQVDDLNTTEVTIIGKMICEHPLFPEQTNVGFMQILTPSHIQLRVYERGVGETRACGSGAVAAAAIGQLYHQLNDEVTVSLEGGDLLVRWPAAKGPIFLQGPATFVYEGQLL